MTLTPADIDRWDPADLWAVSQAAIARAESASATSVAMTQLPAVATWGGAAGDAARATIHATRLALDAHAEEARTVARAADDAAGDVAHLKAQLRQLDDDAESVGLMIDRDTGTVLPGDRLRGTAGQFAAEAGPMMTRLERIVAQANIVDSTLEQLILMADAVLPIPAIPIVPIDPTDTATWWQSLSPMARNQLLEHNPAELGTRVGIPAQDRSIANMSVMTGDLDRIENVATTHRVPVGDIVAQPHRFGLRPNDVIRYSNALRVKQGLEYNRSQTGSEVLLLTYRPEEFNGQGRAAIAIGDPDTAAHTAVLVPGTGNSVASGWLERGDDAPLLYSETVAATGQPEVAAGGAVSVLAWMGYDAPDAIVDPRVAQRALARDGGALLAADVNALQVTHQGPSHVTVIGHSYGATAVADAAAGYGMRTDDVILVGSPGTDLARTAADFHLPDGGHVYVGSAATDPVTNLAGVPGHLLGAGIPIEGVGLGADPAADGFGSTRFKAEFNGWSPLPWTDHDRYFESGSESLYSIAGITSGNGATLQEHGMTAPHRDSVLGSVATALGLPNWSVPLMDPELLRPATTGHHHDVTRGTRS